MCIHATYVQRYQHRSSRFSRPQCDRTRRAPSARPTAHVGPLIGEISRGFRAWSTVGLVITKTTESSRSASGWRVSGADGLLIRGKRGPNQRTWTYLPVENIRLGESCHSKSFFGLLIIYSPCTLKKKVYLVGLGFETSGSAQKTDERDVVSRTNGPGLTDHDVPIVYLLGHSHCHSLFTSIPRATKGRPTTNSLLRQFLTLANDVVPVASI